MRVKRGNRLKLVSEAEAPAPTRAIFDEVRHCLGVPAVPLLYQAYAAIPEFLALHWNAFKPAVQTREFFRLGERLAAEAYTRAQSYFDIPDVRFASQADVPANEGNSQLQEMMAALSYYQYLDPLLLVVTVAQMQAFDGPTGSGTVASHPGEPRRFATAPPLARLEECPAALQRICEERRRSLDLAYVPDEHRALAVWPQLYQGCWSAIQGLVASPLYADCQYRIGESAWGLVRELPVQIETDIALLLEAGLNQEQVSSLARINESLIGGLTGLLLDVTFVRIAGEGGSRTESPTFRPETKDDAKTADSQAA